MKERDESTTATIDRRGVNAYRALRDDGMVASQMQFGGYRHFRFEAQVRHMCCGMCKDACERMPELAATRKAGGLKWLDSVTAERATAEQLIFLAERANRQKMRWAPNDVPLELPCYLYGEYRIWGLSLLMLDELLAALV